MDEWQCKKSESQGEDYVYHGRTEFRGIHKNDVLQVSERQQEPFTHKDAGDLFNAQAIRITGSPQSLTDGSYDPSGFTGANRMLSFYYIKIR
ncbi:MAG: hypothetical protein LBS46_09855 [Dysgonamonadaceae bacterium]|jgi:hypothetical protein|nr:hypothetical protein [Dysgonamonadaceae bacterium]